VVAVTIAKIEPTKYSRIWLAKYLCTSRMVSIFLVFMLLVGNTL